MKTVSSSRKITAAASFPCLLLLVILVLVLLGDTYGFQNYFGRIHNPLLVGRSIPLLTTTTTNSNYADATLGASNTALFMNGMEADPLEDSRRQKNRRLNEKKLVPHQKKGSDSSSQPSNLQQQPQTQKPRLVRPMSTNEAAGANANERKATTSTIGGVNMELKDPKERVLVRHATASSAYGVDAFKGKKKKIIKPWRSGRKKNRHQQSNTGGLGREAYGEDLRVELRNKPKEKRLVMARSNTSGSQDAAKALIAGGSKATPLTAAEIAEEKRIRRRKERKPSMVRQPGSDGDEKPNLVRLSTSMVRQPENGDEPNLVRLSSSIRRKAEDEGRGEPNLVRLGSSIVKEPNEEPEGDLRFYSRAAVSEEDDNDEGAQRLVRAIPASPSSSSDGPTLVRPNIVKARDNGPKLTRPNIVREKAQGPKLVRPNLVRAREVGPKLVRATVQKEKPLERNLVRPNITTGTSDDGKSSSTDGPRLVPAVYLPTPTKEVGPKLVRATVQKKKTQKRKLVRPKTGSVISDNNKFSSTGSPRVAPSKSLTETMKAGPAGDFMYGANASTVSPTAVSLEGKSKRFVKPTSTTSARGTEDFMYGTGRSSEAPTSVSIDLKPKKLVRMPKIADDNATDKLMNDSQQAAGTPTPITPDELTSEKNVENSASFQNSAMDSLMYGATQAMSSPTAVPLEVKLNQEIASSRSSAETLAAGTESNRLGKLQGVEIGNISVDDLMYGHQRATSSPTEVKLVRKSTKFVNPKPDTTDSPKSTKIYPDGDKRKVFNQPRLVRASTQKRYVKPSTSVMDNVPDWDAANPTATTTNPTFVNIERHNINTNDDGEGENEQTTDESKKKKYVRPSASLMDSAPDWDAVQSAFSASNPVAVNFDPQKSKTEMERSLEETKEEFELERPKSIHQKKYVQPSVSSMDSVPNWDVVKPAVTSSNPSVVNVGGSIEEKEPLSNSAARDPKKKYVQPSASLMDNVPDWDAVKPAKTSSNPSVLNVEVPKTKVDAKDKSVSEKPKKKYIQPSSSLMDNAPDWDAVEPPLATSNPTFVNVDVTKPIRETKDESVSVYSKTKKYVQPSGSLMENAPDWDAVQPPMATTNPAVLNVDVSKTKGETEDKAAKELAKKKYVRPSASLMENAPDWDAVKPALSISNPSVVSVVVSSRPDANPSRVIKKKGKEGKLPEERKKQRYVKPSVSLMDSAPDWNAVQPAIASSNPSVVNVDGINRIGEGKRLVRPSSVSMEPETEKPTRPAPADEPFEYKQVQSLPKENPAGAKPVQEEEEKTKLPASIAHAAGSSSDGWTPSAHFPTDDKTNSTRSEESNAKGKRTRSAQSSTMENFDPDALPRPTGVIPLTVSSSAKEKTQLFREEHSLEPVEDEADNGDAKNYTATSSISKESSPSELEPGKKKLFLYDGGNPQHKELWEFSVEGPDTKLDQDKQEETSTGKRKLVAYDGSSGIKGSNESFQVQEPHPENGDFRHSGAGQKLKEKTVSPFTRVVSDAEESAKGFVAKELNESDKDSDSIDTSSKDV
eukprot:jgi/Psemu1/321796/estExt_fgenesh1_pg.C_100019